MSACIFKKLIKIGEFLLKIEENKQHCWHITLYCKKGKNATETQKKICAANGEGAVPDATCQRWFVRFQAGDFSLANAPWSGRPVEVDSDQTKTVIENNQHYTIQEIADILKISKSIKLFVKMKTICLLFYGKN